MSGLAEHVVYNVDAPTSIRAKGSAVVAVRDMLIDGKKGMILYLLFFTIFIYYFYLLFFLLLFYLFLIFIYFVLVLVYDPKENQINALKAIHVTNNSGKVMKEIIDPLFFFNN